MCISRARYIKRQARAIKCESRLRNLTHVAGVKSCLAIFQFDRKTSTNGRRRFSKQDACLTIFNIEQYNEINFELFFFSLSLFFILENNYSQQKK